MFNKLKFKTNLLGFLSKEQPIAFSNAEDLYTDLILLRDEVIRTQGSQNELVEYMNVFIDQFEAKLTTITTEELNKMIQDGRLDNLINQTLLQSINQKVDNFSTDFTTQLAERMVKGKARGSDFDVSSDAYKIKPINISDELMTMFSPAGTVSPIIPNGSVVKEKVAKGANKPYHTNFISSGKNKIDKDAVSSKGLWCNHINGVFEGNQYTTEYHFTDYIPVQGGETFTSKTKLVNIVYFDNTYKHISGEDLNPVNTLPITRSTPLNCAFAVLSFRNIFLDYVQFEKGSVSTNYEEYYNFLTKPKEEEPLSPYQGEVEIVLPPIIHAVTGKEINIYFENVILCDNLENYQIDVNCSIGTQQNERWTSSHTVVGEYPITINLYKEGLKLTSASSIIKVKSVGVGSGVTKKLIIVGDSTINAGKVTQELLNISSSDPLKVSLLGVRGIAPNLNEGRGGWSTDTYVNEASNVSSAETVSNPFYNNGFDFPFYMTQQGYDSVDYVCIHLGINDVFAETTDIEVNNKITSVLNNLQLMVDSIRTYNTGIKVGLMVTVPPSKNQDAFGKNYDTGQTQWRYRRNNFMLVKQMIERFKNKENEGVHLIPVNVNLDTVNNMVTEVVPINSRNTTTVTRQANGVHPADIGYFQMSDVVYFWMKSFEV